MYKTENILLAMAVSFIAMVMLGNFLIKEPANKPAARSIMIVVDSNNRYQGIYSNKYRNWNRHRTPDTCRMFEVEAVLLKDELKKNNRGFDFRVIRIDYYGKTIRDLKQW
jgi:hypothetical protein